MKAVKFDYKRPATIDEACCLLAGDHNARILAGGQSLIPMLSMRLSRPSLLVDIAHIAELTQFIETDHHIEIGAMVRQAVAQVNPLVKTHIPLLAKALEYVGHLPTRARGTIGGSIAHADPSAEIALVAITLNAEITYQDGEDDVVFDASDFFIGPMLTLAPPSGCLVRTGFPKAPAICGTGFHEVAPRRSDYALASAAAQISASVDGRIEKIDVGVGSVGDFPERLKVDALLTSDLGDDTISQVLHAAMADIETVEDLHASAAYRKRVATELAIRAVRDALNEIKKGTRQ
ncbi:FAD binding domain-containing protein [Candidatus Puniceispirillum sp.]|nr:FAD binding domain-containing protein [Candidatus Puniceispirillum sp.]